MVTVLVPQSLRTLTEGEAVLTAEGHNLRAVIRDLAPRYPELGRIASSTETESAEASPSPSTETSSQRGLITKVPEGAEISIVPQISGG